MHGFNEYSNALPRIGHLPNNFPIFPCGTWRRYCSPPKLRTTLSIDPRCRLLSVRGTRKANICQLCTKVSVVALVNDECVSRDGCWIDVIGIEEIDKLGFRPSGLLRRNKADVVGGGTRGSLKRPVSKASRRKPRGIPVGELQSRSTRV